MDTKSASKHTRQCVRSLPPHSPLPHPPHSIPMRPCCSKTSHYHFHHPSITTTAVKLDESVVGDSHTARFCLPATTGSAEAAEDSSSAVTTPDHLCMIWSADGDNAERLGKEYPLDDTVSCWTLLDGNTGYCYESQLASRFSTRSQFEAIQPFLSQAPQAARRPAYGIVKISLLGKEGEFSEWVGHRPH